MIPEEIDLNDLRRQLATRFGEAPPAGYVRGKGDLRAAVVAILKCSELEAEQLVDTLESRRLIRYQGDPAEAIDQLENLWRLNPS
jgi:hypothetical protein